MTDESSTTLLVTDTYVPAVSNPSLTLRVPLSPAVPPETVTLRSPPEPVTAGRPVTLTCHVTGAEPMAVISWRRGSSPVPADPPLASADGNGTVSQLTFTPDADDQGQTVTCSAMTPAAGGAAIEDAVTLHVHCELRTASLLWQWWV